MKKKFISITTGILALIAVSGCQDYVDGINTDPNDPTNAPLNNLLVSTQVYLGSTLEGSDARYSALWTQQATGEARQHESYENYDMNASNFDWSNHMVAIANIKLALEKAEAVNNRATVGMLLTMQALSVATNAALYGDMPFSQMMDLDQFPDPVFDNQADVYQGADDLLTAALVELNSGVGFIPNVDFFLDSNVSAWIKAAHTIKARIALHVGDYAKAVSEAQQGISSLSGNVKMTHGDVLYGNVNIWYDFLEVNRAGDLGASNAYLPRLLDSTQPQYRGNAKTSEAARLSYYYNGSVGGYYFNTDPDGIFNYSNSYYFLTHEENQLILAEALMKISTPNEAGALAALNSVRLALRTQYPTGQYDNYLLADFDVAGIANTGQPTRAAAMLQEIYEEKYATLFGQIEVFNDFRRLNNPLGLVPRTGTSFPQRFLIPTEEIVTNSNVPDPLPGLFDKTPVNQ